ncbi:MAG: hypothetical protein Kapaf2KO_17700 [Candidatus Kapaibacteriales bacterium]
MKHKILNRFLPILALAFLLASCTANEDPLSTQDALKEDISGKPIYEGLLNDTLEYSLIPLAEANWWNYDVLTEHFEFNSSEEVFELESDNDNFTMSCTGTFSLKDYRWFDIEFSKDLSLALGNHLFINDVIALSNRAEGLLQMKEPITPDHNLSQEDYVGEVSMLMPYTSQTYSNRDFDENTTLEISKNETFSTGGITYRNLTRYSYFTDAGIEISNEEFLGIGLRFDYYFREDIGLVAFEYNNQLADQIPAEFIEVLSVVEAVSQEDLELLKTKRILITLTNYELIEI